MQIYYLEIVTNAVEQVCNAYAKSLSTTFSEPVAELGNARTGQLLGKGLIGVRSPMHGSEDEVVRPYWLVDDIEKSLAAALAAGAEVAHPPLEIAGYGTFAIYIQGGIQHGLWQL